MMETLALNLTGGLSLALFRLERSFSQQSAVALVREVAHGDRKEKGSNVS
jgi:hypothetical protein